MWRWQRRRVRRWQALWAKLCTISLVCHLLFAVWFFGVEHNGISLAFVVRAAATSPTQTASLCLYSPPAPVAKAVVTSVKTMAAKPKALATVATKKPEQKKQPQKVVAKKEEPKKQDTKVAKQAEPSKPLAKKVETPQMQKVASATKEQPSKQPLVEPVAASSEELLGAQLQQTVMAHWAPPPGVDDGCFCTLAFRVDWSGQVQEVEVRKASGVLMYDIAAKCALNETKLPSWARGKSLTITFRQ